MALTDSIDWGTIAHTNGGVINVYFATGGETYDGVTSNGWSAYEIQQAMAAFAVYEDVINVTFNQVFDPVQSQFQLVTTTNVWYLGYFNPPGTFNAGVGVFATDGVGWNTTGGLEQGGYGFITLIHEFGHAMGLAHPHDTGGTSSIMQGVTSSQGDLGDFDLNQGVFTTMTYNDGWQTAPHGTPFSNNYGWQGSLMALDIAVLQDKYGANTSFNAGNNTYILPASNGANTFYSAIWDTGGTDTIRHTGTFAATIDLRPASLNYEQGGGGYVSYVGGIHGGFTIAAGVMIENAYGGSGNDIITGNDVNNLLRGNSGNDRLYGKDANDRLYGNNGIDKLYGGLGDDRLYGGNDDDKLYGNSGNDKLYGGNGNDYLRGDNGNDRLYGNKGNDRLEGRNGNDRLYGEDGIDKLYGGLGDDRLYGGNGNDKLYGNSGNDYLNGQNGDDYLRGDNGNDRLYGSKGNDTLLGQNGDDKLYGGDDDDMLYGGVGVDRLYGGFGIDRLYGEDGIDRLYGEDGIDRLYGGLGDDRLYGGNDDDKLYGGSGNDFINGQNGDDYLRGDNGNDRLYGGKGNDTLLGKKGDDKLYGGSGNDELSGGVGIDSFFFESNWGDDTITDFDVSGNEIIDFSDIAAITNINDLSIIYGAGNTIITFGSDSITLIGTTEILQSNDFLFA